MNNIWQKWLNCIALRRKSISEVRSVTCYLVSHIVTRYPMQVNVPCDNSC